MHRDDTLYMEAYEKMLDAWMTFLSDGVDLLVEDALKHNAVQIFDAFLKCHLSPPDGSRNQVCLMEQTAHLYSLIFWQQMETSVCALTCEFGGPLRN